MARRVGARRGSRRVPGLSAALADHARMFAEKWGHGPTGDPLPQLAEMLERAEACERGDPMIVTGSIVWAALANAGSPHEHLFFVPYPHPMGTYEITGFDEIRLEDMEVDGLEEA